MKYECHITIEPVFGDRLKLFESHCKKYNFKVAKLIMVDGKPNQRDSFCTGRSDTYSDMYSRMCLLVSDLKGSLFLLHRAKIEEILLDERFI